MCVGAIEEILMEEEFFNSQNNFCKKHCDSFEDTDENKLSYTALFEEYTVLMETMLNSRLQDKVRVSVSDSRQCGVAAFLFLMLSAN